MLKLLLAAPVRTPSVAFSTYAVPTLSTVRFVNVATPLTAATDVVPPRLAPTVPPLSVNATVDVLPVTVLPAASSTVTVAPNTAADCELPGGCAVHTSFEDTPAVIFNVLLVAPVSTPLEAAS